MKLRIVWKQGKTGGRWDERIAPHQRKGGTCEYAGQIFVFDELSGTVSIQGGQVLHQRHNKGFVNSCSLEDVAAVIDENGRQVYPIIPAE